MNETPRLFRAMRFGGLEPADEGSRPWVWRTLFGIGFAALLLLAVSFTLSGCKLPPIVIPTPPPTTTTTTTQPPEPPATTTTTTLPPEQPPVTQPPAPQACPHPVPMGNRAIWIKIVSYGEDGKGKRFGATPRVVDSLEYCSAWPHAEGVKGCKCAPEGSGARACDTDCLAGLHCPIWQWSTDGKTWQRCMPDGEGGPGQDITCDHFDMFMEDGPYTGFCDRNKDGNPITGFDMIGHGDGLVRACTADGICSEPLGVKN